MSRRYFGTDGIRGTVGEYPITPDFMLKLGWAAGRVFSRGGQHQNVLIGKDTRISGYMFESAIEAGLSAAGVNTQLLGPMPTPGVAYLTRTFRAQAGIVISASHNPYYDNGIKFFGPDGMKLPDNIEQEIEHELDKPLVTVASEKIGKASRIEDASGRYIEFCKSTIPARMDFDGIRLIVDCAHGSAYHIAPHVFEEIGATVIPVGAQPNGLNINDEVGATNPKALTGKVLDHSADLGIALDGDGDRVILVDNKGEIVDGDEILYIIAASRNAKGEMAGPVIGTQMSNLGLQRALEKNLGLAFKRAAVGDRYVSELMIKYNSMLGGESSGHIICRDRVTTGDGIVSALQVLAAITESGRPLYELKQAMTKYPQCLVNVRISERLDPAGLHSVQEIKEQIEAELGANGRVLIRSSGTEPLIRIMVEGVNLPQVRDAANRLARSVSEALAL